ncbi:hypothetical protein BH11PLA2_BH11PLA2_32670 [soil metagenome]
MIDDDDDYDYELNAVPFGSGNLRLSVADVKEIERRRALQRPATPFRSAA